MVSQERVGLLARKAWWSRENMLVCSRGRAGGLASACLYAREEGLVVSRVRVRETTSTNCSREEKKERLFTLLFSDFIYVGTI